MGRSYPVMRSEIVQLWFDCLTVVCFKYRDLSGNRQEIRVPAITKGIYSGTPFGASKLHFGATIRSMLWSKPRLWSENSWQTAARRAPRTGRILALAIRRTRCALPRLSGCDLRPRVGFHTPAIAETLCPNVHTLRYIHRQRVRIAVLARHDRRRLQTLAAKSHLP